MSVGLHVPVVVEVTHNCDATLYCICRMDAISHLLDRMASVEKVWMQEERLSVSLRSSTNPCRKMNEPSAEQGWRGLTCSHKNDAAAWKPRAAVSWLAINVLGEADELHASQPLANGEGRRRLAACLENLRPGMACRSDQLPAHVHLHGPLLLGPGNRVAACPVEVSAADLLFRDH